MLILYIEQWDKRTLFHYASLTARNANAEGMQLEIKPFTLLNWMWKMPFTQTFWIKMFRCVEHPDLGVNWAYCMPPYVKSGCVASACCVFFHWRPKGLHYTSLLLSTSTSPFPLSLFLYTPFMSSSPLQPFLKYFILHLLFLFFLILSLHNHYS